MRKIFTLCILLFISLPSVALEAGDLKKQLPGDYVLGKDSAKVTIIEYASLSCGHCAKFHNDVLPTIKKEYIDKGKVRLILRDYPLNAPALAGSQLAHCVAKQGGADKYYAVVKQMFAEQKTWAFAKDFKSELVKIGEKNGLDKKEVDGCFGDKALEEKILNTVKEAKEKLGVSSTPTFFVNGDQAEHMHSVEETRKVLDTVLSGKSLGQEAKDAAKKIAVINSSDMVLGSDKAKVSIIEYSNIGCPHCGEFHKTLLTTIQKDYIDSGKVKYAFRELPLSPATFYAYMVASCNGKKDFYKNLSVLADGAKSWAATPAFINPLKAIAMKAGIKQEQFYSCMDNRNNENRIMKNFQEAQSKLGIKHSPVVFINGEKAEGLSDSGSIRKKLDMILAKSGK